MKQNSRQHRRQNAKLGTNAGKHGTGILMHGTDAEKHGIDNLKHGADAGEHGKVAEKHGAGTWKHDAGAVDGMVGGEYENLPLVQSKEEAVMDPFEINFLPEFTQNRGPREAFVNEYGAVIGDHVYESPASPLNNWTEETDPTSMTGEQWVHPFKDIGFHSTENKDYFEKGIPPQGGTFMHPDKDVAYKSYQHPAEEEGADERN